MSYIREESAEVDDSRGLREDTYRDLHTNDMVDREDEDQSDDDDVAEWDEESTLVALLDYECVYALLILAYSLTTLV